jgi:hypothetical protein
MVERRIELDRRYHRKEKMRKLKKRLAAAKGGEDRDKILGKIRRLSPFWTEASQPSAKGTGPAATKEPKEPREEPKKKAPPKKKPEKPAAH